VGALVRLGTGTPDDPLQLLDLGTGDGQHDVEVQLAADAVSGRRLAASLVARYGVQLADELDVLLPDTFLPDGYPLATNLQRVRRDLGDYLELEIAPRYALTELIAVGAHYRFRSKGEDTYELPLLPPTAAAGGWSEPTSPGPGTATREHLAGFGVVLSTLAAYARGETRVPVEVSYRHARTVAGAGRLAPHGSRDELTLRVFVNLFGGR
jgi:hypothetical protein